MYAKRPFTGPAHVLDYLGRYSHRVALSNDRLIDHRDGRVRFRWKDYADHDRVKVMTLEADEFLRRFLLHVVPRGFVRIRHFGLLANAQRRATIAQARHLLGVAPSPPVSDESASADLALPRCPVCQQGHWRRVEILPPLASRRAPLSADTS